MQYTTPNGYTLEALPLLDPDQEEFAQMRNPEGEVTCKIGAALVDAKDGTTYKDFSLRVKLGERGFRHEIFKPEVLQFLDTCFRAHVEQHKEYRKELEALEMNHDDPEMER